MLNKAYRIHKVSINYLNVPLQSGIDLWITMKITYLIKLLSLKLFLSDLSISIAK